MQEPLTSPDFSSLGAPSPKIGPGPGGRTTEATVSDLVLDPRHTGGNNLTESAFLKHAGALQWQAIARYAGRPLGSLRCSEGRPVYACFYYVHEHFPRATPMSSFAIDDTLRFATSVSAFGGTMVDGCHRVWCPGAHAASAAAPIHVQMSNVFVAKKSGPEKLEVAAPDNAALDRMHQSCERPSSYQRIKEVRRRGRFPVVEPFASQEIACRTVRLAIDPDRDVNGAGLVYFANYVTFLDSAERALLDAVLPTGNRKRSVLNRSLVEREIAYYGNAEATDTVEVDIALRPSKLQTSQGEATMVRFDYRCRRASDGRLVCISHAAKLLPIDAGEVPLFRKTRAVRVH